MEGLAKAGVKPLRVGFNGNIQKSLIEHSLDHKLQTHPLHSTLVRVVNDAEKLSRQMQELSEALKKLDKKLWEAKNPTKSIIERGHNMRNGLISIRDRHKHLQQKIYSIQQKMLREIVAAADVVSAQI